MQARAKKPLTEKQAAIQGKAAAGRLRLSDLVRAVQARWLETHGRPIHGSVVYRVIKGERTSAAVDALISAVLDDAKLTTEKGNDA